MYNFEYYLNNIQNYKYMSSLEFLNRYISPYNKIRLGSEYDGGYVIADGLSYNELISCGISDDVTFENDFISKYNVNE